MQAPPILEPTRLKVFGILHIIFASLGLLFAAISLLGAASNRAFDQQMKGLEGHPEQVLQAMEKINDAQFTHSLVTSIIALIVALLCLFAGIALVRKARNCVKLSNVYVFASFGAKVISVILFFTVLNPAITSILDGIEAPNDDVKLLFQTLKVGVVVLALIVPILFAIYPFITVIMLNKPIVKDFLAQHGK